MKKSTDRRVFKIDACLHKVTGLWPKDDQPFGRFSRVKSYAVAIMVVTCTSFQHTALFDIQDTETMLECVTECLTSLIGVAKILPIVYNRDNILKLIDDTMRIDAFKNTIKEEINISNRWIKYQDELIKLVIRSYTSMIIFLYLIVPIVTNKSFPLQGIMPNFFLVSPWYQIVYVLESFFILIVITGLLSSDAFSITFLCQLCKELEIVQCSMKKLGRKNSISLNRMIERHAIALDYGGRICDNFTTMFLIQHFIVSAFLCFAGIVIMKTQNSIIVFKTIIFGVIVVSTLLIICFVGELVTSASLGVAEAIENSDYENFVGDVTSLKTISFILCRAQKPLRMKVACLGSMNLRFFSETINKIVSFFMILSNLME